MVFEVFQDLMYSNFGKHSEWHIGNIREFARYRSHHISVFGGIFKSVKFVYIAYRGSKRRFVGFVDL